MNKMLDPEIKTEFNLHINYSGLEHDWFVDTQPSTHKPRRRSTLTKAQQKKRAKKNKMQKQSRRLNRK